MRVSQIVPSLEEKHGGPSRSVYALSRALAELDHDVRLFTTTPGPTSERKQGGLAVSLCRRDWPHTICASRALQKQLRATACDIIHHHAVWLRSLHYAHRCAIQRRVPLVVSPRGMLCSWAWNHHRWRKQVARYVVHRGAFDAAAGWHATSVEEADDIRRLGFRQPVCVAPNGVTEPSADARQDARAYWIGRCPEVEQRPVALFYSRFHQKKRVVELIDTWLSAAPRDWLLLMVGLPEEYSATELENYVMRNSGADRIRVFNGEDCPPPYAVASLFVLPSHSENFGLVIAEAMSHGLPVIVTDTTPWSAVNTEGVGWCVPWERYARALREACSEAEADRRARGTRARAFVLSRYSWEQSAKTLLDFYGTLLKSNG